MFTTCQGAVSGRSFRISSAQLATDGRPPSPSNSLTPSAACFSRRLSAIVAMIRCPSCPHPNVWAGLTPAAQSQRRRKSVGMDEERGIAPFYHRLAARINQIGWARRDDSTPRADGWRAVLAPLIQRLGQVAKGGGDSDRNSRSFPKLSQGLGQARQLSSGALAQGRERSGGRETPACAHDRLNQGFPILRIIGERHDIIGDALGCVVVPIHLFPARPGRLPFRSLPTGPPRICLKLVSTVQVGGIGW